MPAAASLTRNTGICSEPCGWSSTNMRGRVKKARNRAGTLSRAATAIAAAPSIAGAARNRRRSDTPGATPNTTSLPLAWSAVMGCEASPTTPPYTIGRDAASKERGVIGTKSSRSFSGPPSTVKLELSLRARVLSGIVWK